MSRVNFLDSIKSGITLLGDGATGSYLQTKGLEPGGCPEYMCHTAPDVIKGMAKNYFENGSDFVLTNSFGGNSFMLEKYGHKPVWANQWEPKTKTVQHAYNCYVHNFGNFNDFITNNYSILQFT